MKEAEFLQQLNEVFELDAGTINPDDYFRNLPDWDSMTFLGLIAMVDEYTGVTLDPDDVLECQSARDLFCMVERKQMQNAA